jgi:predicted RNase H-like HicB family nuclease
VKRNYPVVFVQEVDGRFSVSAPDLAGCFSWGNTRDEARERIVEAIELWIESATADGEAIPDPGSSVEIVQTAA